MTNPVPARAHANSSVEQREFTFDALLAEFGEFDDSVPQKRSDAAGPGEAAILLPDTPAAQASPAVTPLPAPAAPSFVASFELPTAERATAPDEAPDEAPDAALDAAPAAVPATVEEPRQAPQREQPKRKQPQQEQRAKRAPLRLALPSVQALQLIGLGLVAAVCLTLAVIALSR